LLLLVKSIIFFVSIYKRKREGFIEVTPPLVKYMRDVPAIMAYVLCVAYIFSSSINLFKLGNNEKYFC